MKLSELLLKGEFSSSYDTEGIEIDRIETDKELATKGCLFIFNRSKSFDISDIVDCVISKNPSAIICDEELEMDTGTIPVFRVRDTRKATAYAYSRFHAPCYSKIKFIGITGTNGKTTTALVITKILNDLGKRVGFIGTGKIEICGIDVTPKNHSMTTPDPKLLYRYIKDMDTEECEYIVMEVTSHALFYQKTAPIPFEIAAFTNLSAEHMDFHSDMSDYYRTKLGLFQNARMGIFNADDVYSRRAMADFTGNGKSIGIIYDADYRAKEINHLGLHGTEYIFQAKNFIFKAKTNLPGAYNVYNTMMAMSILAELGFSPCDIKSSLLKIQGIEGRFEIIESDITVIIDYAHTIEAYSNLLKTVKNAQNIRQRLISLFGCGGNRDKAKRPEIAKISERYSDLSIITEDNCRSESQACITEDILKGFTDAAKYTVIPSRKEAIEYAILTASRDDTVAIIGKGPERYTIDKNGYHEFDERKIINDALKKRMDIIDRK